MINDAERSAEIPEGVHPFKFLKDRKQVRDPAEGDIVRCVLETTELTNVNPRTAFFNLPPGPIGILQSRAVPQRK